jgi:ATP-dependent RNA helicase HelY
VGRAVRKLRRQTDKLRQQIDTRTGTVARIFDRVVDVLTALTMCTSMPTEPPR